MEIILVGIYASIVWLIYFRFKLLPWAMPHKVAVVVLPVVALATEILSLNYFAPTSHDARVINYVVQIVPQIRGHVIAVPAQGNQHMKKGDVLFQIDPTPYALDVRRLEAQLANAQASADGGLKRPSRDGGLYRKAAGAAGLDGGTLGMLNEAVDNKAAGVIPSSAC